MFNKKRVCQTRTNTLKCTKSTIETVLKAIHLKMYLLIPRKDFLTINVKHILIWKNKFKTFNIYTKQNSISNAELKK